MIAVLGRLKAQFFQGDKKIFSLNKSSDLILLFCCSSISEKLHSINKMPCIGGLACLCTTAIKCNSVLLYCFCIIVTTLTVDFDWKEWSMNGQVCMYVCNRDRRETPEETSEQGSQECPEGIIRSSVPRWSNWGMYSFCQALRTPTPDYLKDLSLTTSCSITSSSRREQQKFIPIAGMAQS